MTPLPPNRMQGQTQKVPEGNEDEMKVKRTFLPNGAKPHLLMPSNGPDWIRITEM